MTDGSSSSSSFSSSSQTSASRNQAKRRRLQERLLPPLYFLYRFCVGLGLLAPIFTPRPISSSFAVHDQTFTQVSSATFAQLNKQVLVTRGLKFRPGDPLHVKTFDDMADEEVPTFFIEMVRVAPTALCFRKWSGNRTTRCVLHGVQRQNYDDAMEINK